MVIIRPPVLGPTLLLQHGRVLEHTESMGINNILAA